MSAESGIARPRGRGGFQGLLYGTAVFWFAVLGGLAVLAAIVLMPLACYGDPAPGSPGACPNGVPSYIEDGSLARFAATIVGIVVIAVIAWLATAERVTARAVLMLVLAAAGVASIALVFATAGGVALLTTVWLGVPIVLLTTGGAGLIYRHGSRTPSDRVP